MPRIRTVKPEFWQDEKLAVLDPLTRLVFLGLISMADDAGRLVDNLKMIDGFIFPETSDSAAGSLDVLAKSSRICRYASASGQRLVQIRNWERHQKVDHPNKYVLPAPTTEDLAAPTPSIPSRELPENGAKLSRDPLATTNDLRPTTNDLLLAAGAANGAKPKRSRPSRAPPAEPSPNWPAEFAALYSQHIGEVEIGRIGRRCKSVVRKYGLGRATEMWAAYCQFGPHRRYGGEIDPEYDNPEQCSPERFAGSAKWWFRYTEPLAIPSRET